MKHIMSITMSVALSALAAQSAVAQWNVARFENERNSMYTTLGIDPAVVASLGYGRVVKVAGHNFQVASEVGIGTAKVDARDFRAQISAQSAVLSWRSAAVVGSATFITRGTDNAIYRGLNLGADVTGAAGVYKQRWFAAGEFGKDKAIITNIKHKDWYRENFYPDAKDGWYLDAGGTYHYGAVAGVTVGRTQLVARGGWLRTEDFNDLTPPMYLTLGVGVGF